MTSSYSLPVRHRNRSDSLPTKSVVSRRGVPRCRFATFSRRVYRLPPLQTYAHQRDGHGCRHAGRRPYLYLAFYSRLDQSVGPVHQIENRQPTRVADMPGYPTRKLLLGGPETRTKAGAEAMAAPTLSAGLGGAGRAKPRSEGWRQSVIASDTDRRRRRRGVGVARLRRWSSGRVGWTMVGRPANSLVDVLTRVAVVGAAASHSHGGVGSVSGVMTDDGWCCVGTSSGGGRRRRWPVGGRWTVGNHQGACGGWVARAYSLATVALLTGNKKQLTLTGFRVFVGFEILFGNFSS